VADRLFDDARDGMRHSWQLNADIVAGKISDYDLNALNRFDSSPLVID
jgi:hypothetical protein